MLVHCIVRLTEVCFSNASPVRSYCLFPDWIILNNPLFVKCSEWFPDCISWTFTSFVKWYAWLPYCFSLLHFLIERWRILDKLCLSGALSGSLTALSWSYTSLVGSFFWFFYCICSLCCSITKRHFLICVGCQRLLLLPDDKTIKISINRHYPCLVPLLYYIANLLC